MAKILVADDNSNIQKMVGLALKDQGIDVVAVGNGEAAVRKAVDIRPDLVLADVFMPVRNGYEVCEYIKADASLKHIPVILLVGAFDPLDEQEAQRVGADGVLKKPFVPPDPLISMVKAALAKAGVSVGGVPAPKVEEPAQLRGTDLLTPRKEKAPEAAPVVALPPAPEPAAQEPAFAAPLEEMSFVDEIPAPPAPVKFESGSSAVAFGNLLGTQSPAEDDAVFQTSNQLMDRDFGGKQEAETEEEEEEAPKSSWRRDSGEIDAPAASDAGTGGSQKDWRDTAIAEIPARADARESWNTSEQKSDFAEAANAGEKVLAAVKEFPAQAAREIPQNIPFAGDAWAAAMSPTLEEKRQEAPAVAVAEAKSETAVEEQAAQIQTESAPQVENSSTAVEAEKSSGTNGWLSSAPSPWEADAKKASHLAASWDAPAPAADPVATAPETISQENAVAAVEAMLPTATVEEIREEVSHVAHAAEETPGEVTASAAATEVTAAEPSMDELVARVLSKMSPEALQAVTREILKPVVEAIVREELSKK